MLDDEFKQSKFKELDFDLKTRTTEEGRRYLTPSGDAYPSVTTVLSEYNKKSILEYIHYVKITF